MPSDIRSFFGGQRPAPEYAAKDADTKPVKKQRARKVVSDDSDDEVVQKIPKKDSTKITKPRKEIKESEVEETTSSAYFASNKTKTSRSTPIRAKSALAANGAIPQTPTKLANRSTPSTGRRSSRKTAIKNYDEGSDDQEARLADEGDGKDDIHAENYSKSGRLHGDDYEEASEDDEFESHPKLPKAVAKKAVNGKKAFLKGEDSDLEMAEIPPFHGAGQPRRKRGSTSTTASRKRKAKDLDDEKDDDGDDDKFLDDDQDAPKKTSKKPGAKPVAKKPKAKEQDLESDHIKAIFDSIPIVRAPTPPPRDENMKFQFQFGGGNAKAAPIGSGSKDIPVGAENCLAGLTFVFTGVLESIGREEGQSLVKRYGGKITTAPSKNTSYVVLGSDAGPKKLETIAKLGIKTINEDGLFELIRRLPANGGDGKAAEKQAEKKAKEMEKIQADADEMDRLEKEKIVAAAKAEKARIKANPTLASTQSASPKKPTVDSRLWVDKYAPDTITAVCGNKGLVTSLQNWLRNWHQSAHWGFKKAGPDGKGIYRAAMLHGPPGVGKTTAAHLVAKLEGFDIVESNASDTRSKKLVETGLKGVLDTTSLLGYFAGDGKKVDAKKKKLVLIMDEVDGMSAGDRGGVGALAAVAKKTNIPMILICNERRLPKMKPFDNVTADFPFRRPTADMIRARIMTICYREGIKIPPNAIDALIEGSNADIRQIINMISTVKLDQRDLDYQAGKDMSKAWEKHVILKPWDIVSKILRPQMFAPSSTATLNDKIELYFNDHEFSHMMLQENYLKTQPAAIGGLSGTERNRKFLELADNAASSISDGDLVDRMIHGTQQQWSLMPTHAVFSFVRPASFMHGNFQERPQFVTWLGQNSKYGKLSREIKEIQGHMRLRASGDRHEVRQQYLPALWNKTVGRLQIGKEEIPEVIDFMDSYFLTREDFDNMVELGVGPMDAEHAKLETQVKAAFTRMYNAQSHPLPFMKASTVVAPKSAKKVKPDLEDAIDESDDEGEGPLADGGMPEEDDEEMDLKKDKYVKVPKKKKAAAPAKGKKTATKNGGSDDEDDDGDVKMEDSEEDVKPKKKKATTGKGRAGRGRGKG